MNLLNKVNGWKTYLVAGAMALYAVCYLGWYEGNWDEAWKVIMEAGAISGLRHALTK